MSDNETNLAILSMAVIAGMIFAPLFFGGNNTDDQENCTLEWVECDPDDRVGDCQIFKEEITKGAYYNQTTEIEITLKKQVCVDSEG